MQLLAGRETLPARSRASRKGPEDGGDSALTFTLRAVENRHGRSLRTGPNQPLRTPILARLISPVMGR